MTEETTTVIDHVPATREGATDNRLSLRQLVEQVDEADDDTENRIVMQVLNAAEAEDVDAPWQARKLSDWDGEIVTVHSLKRMSSNLDADMPYYLVVHGVEGRTGKPVTATTSSKAVMAQLIKLHLLGALPLSVIPRRAERPTTRGFHPEHLEIVR